MTAPTTRTAVVVQFELLPRGSWRASAHGCELDLWQVATQHGHKWRWSTLGPDLRYRGGGDCETWEAAAEAAETAARTAS